jgi:hypothetical protein
MKKSLLWIVLLFLPLLGANDKEIFWNTYTAALRGDKEAQFQTGVMFERGIGTDENQSQAAKWYEKAAIQGHMDAQYNIGIMYASGRGIEQNDQFAMMWLATSAKQGDKDSRKLLLGLVDGKTTTDNKSSFPSENTLKKQNTLIKPIRFETKEGAMMCTMPNTSQCTVISEKQIFTSKSKQANYYKISGVIAGHKWKDYEGEGYIEMSTVELK